MKTKVDIISGFLGAGKTTLIKKLLEEKIYGEKLMIIENEFGEVGIDGTLLKKSGIEIREINSGCICCTLMDDFEKSIVEVIQRFKPDRIIIEPSGVGKLSDVVSVCQSPRVRELVRLNAVLAVVDVLKCHIYLANFGEFYENQIKTAKTIVLSRTDNASAEKLQSTVNILRELNPGANIITTPWKFLKAGQILAVAEGDASISLENQLNGAQIAALKVNDHSESCECGHKHKHVHSHHGKCGCGAHDHCDHGHSADEVFDVWGIETPKVFNEDELRQLVSRLDDSKTFGTVLRGKGILQTGTGHWVQFDFVPEEVKLVKSNPDYTGRICIIGSNLNKMKLGKLFGVAV